MFHRRAAKVLAAVVVSDAALGALFGAADHCGTWNGLYWAVTTVTTTGYGDIVPRGWAAHLAALAVMILVIPLWSSVFALVATGFTASHIDTRHEQMTDHVTAAVRGTQ